MPRNPKLREFVEEVDAAAKPPADTVTVQRETAVAAAKFITDRLAGASRGGAKRWRGKKLSDDPAAVRNRKAVRKFRKKQAQEK